MAKANSIMDDLRNELEELHQHYPAMKNEDLFVVWFLRAYVTEDLEAAAHAVTNGPKDKGADAVFIDDASRCVFIIQGKYRHQISTANEKRSEVLSFAQLGHILADRDKKAFQNLVDEADQSVAQKLTEARKRLLHRDYRLWLYYVTLGKCSAGLRSEAEEMARCAPGKIRFEILDGRRLMLLMSDYLDGVAPPIPTLDLVMENGQGILVNGILQRFDSRSKIESWVFSMQGDDIVHLYEVGGKRLFARNVRGFLGETTDVNRSMEKTLKKEPERFFYYNNGITILCDDAKLVSSKGKDILRVNNPQVINGQQTTRTLARKVDHAKKSSVVVRVIQVSRGESNRDDYFDTLVSRIVEGTNWQNAIKPSDLVSNDRRQVELQRELRKRGYLYLRKRESKSEARRAAGSKHYILVKKEDLARAVAGCDLDPVEARSGVENLFDEDTYRIIFPTSDPRYYLLRYWLMREVTYCAHSYPERGYAKWLVLGFVWSRLQPLLGTVAKRDNFIHKMERGAKDLDWPLFAAVEKAYIAALKYWKKNRGKGAKVTDVSTFFRNKRGRDKEFKSFWQGKNNKGRKGFEAAWMKVKVAIANS
ncbi:MAG: hypothetical protein A2V67_11070 [Deltaproteobacteria bacterium RBG_13_61_14]|nr:MAG: hypothetical protein A2V67_11070 [Deltaproteobacteria bacterium RBG_13_61_14]